MENNENFEPEVTQEVTENVEQTTEETPVKTYTQEEVDAMMGKRVARTEAKIRKEYERKYSGLTDVLKAGTGKESVEEMTDTFREFYERKGIKIQKKPDYSDKDIELLARAEAEDIIRGGHDEAVAEFEYLEKLGTKMNGREQARFKLLADHLHKEAQTRELAQIGVTEDVYQSKEFQDFMGKFNPNTPITEVYNIFQQTKPKKNYQTMGSMKQVPEKGVKDYYSPAEIEKLTEDELRDPKVWEAVRRSMTGR